MRRNHLVRIITSLTNEAVITGEQEFLYAESDILATLGFDLNIETSIEYIDAFLRAFREEL